MSAKGTSKWTHDAIMEVALQFETRAEFHRGAVAAYAAARRSPYGLDHFCQHMKRVNERWTFKKILAAAQKFATLQEFRESNYAAYTAGIRTGRTDEIYAHMRTIRVPQDRYIYAITSNDNKTAYIGLSKNPARRYRQHKRTGRECVKRLIEGPHNFDILLGPLTEDEARAAEVEAMWGYSQRGITLLNATAGGALGGIVPRIWTREDIQAEALKYTQRSEFRRLAGGAYKASVAFGGAAQFCTHMPSRRPTKWTYETIREEAKKHKTRRQFELHSGRAVQVARKLGIMDDVCSHMEWKAQWPNPSNDNQRQAVAA